MTTAIKQHRSINWMRMSAAAAVAVLVLGIGGAVGYAVLRERTPQVGYSGEISEPASVVDLSVFGLDAGNFFREPQADSNLNMTAGDGYVSWAYEGEEPSLTSGAAYADADYNLLYLSNNGEFLGLEANLPEEQRDRLYENYASIDGIDVTLCDWLRTVIPDFDQFTMSDVVLRSIDSVMPPRIFERHYKNGTKDIIQVSFADYYASNTKDINIHVMRCRAEDEHFLDTDRYEAAARGLRGQIDSYIRQTGLNVKLMPESDTDFLPMLMRFDDGNIYAMDSILLMQYDEEGAPCQTVSAVILADPAQNVRYEYFGELLAPFNDGRIPQAGTLPNPYDTPQTDTTVYTTVTLPAETTVDPAETAVAPAETGADTYTYLPGGVELEPGEYTTEAAFGSISVQGLYPDCGEMPGGAGYENFAGYLLFFYARPNEEMRDAAINGISIRFRVYDENHDLLADYITDAVVQQQDDDEIADSGQLFMARVPLEEDIRGRQAYVTCQMHNFSLSNHVVYGGEDVPVGAFFVGKES